MVEGTALRNAIKCCLFSVIFSTLALTSKASKASVKWDQASNTYAVHDGIVNDWIAWGTFSNEINQTGWSYLEVYTRSGPSDSALAYAAGLVEGRLTKELIALTWRNSIKGYCDKPYNAYCLRLRDYLLTNLAWLNQQIRQHDDTSEYWHQVRLFFEQLSGLQDGFDNKPSQPSYKVKDVFAFLMFQISGDLEDLETALHKKDRKHVLGSGSCSALIKLLAGNKDLFVAHDTWSSYISMLRILKKYSLMYKRSPSTERLGPIPGHTQTFSSYPGYLYSGDDYYITNAGLVTLETTNGNSNTSLNQFIKPLGTVLEGIRTTVANRLSVTGQQWAEYFSRYNSGTYNNQWMVVDYKAFKPGHPLPSQGLLTVLEQIPGLIISKDLTHVLQDQKYWASYNVPYFPEIFNMSGQGEMVKKYGDWFSHDHTARANIFRRDQGKVLDMDGMMKLMRYNDYTHDPFSKCKCSPPYSAENGISARCDLNPANGTYPIGALGHRSHGGTDMKATSSSLAQNLEFMAISGPTFDPLPPFQWSKADFAKDTPHEGHPDLWKFPPVLHKWGKAN